MYIIRIEYETDHRLLVTRNGYENTLNAESVALDVLKCFRPTSWT